MEFSQFSNSFDWLLFFQWISHFYAEACDSDNIEQQEEVEKVYYTLKIVAMFFFFFKFHWEVDEFFLSTRKCMQRIIQFEFRLIIIPLCIKHTREMPQSVQHNEWALSNSKHWDGYEFYFFNFSIKMLNVSITDMCIYSKACTWGATILIALSVLELSSCNHIANEKCKM
jgi:hypothetical protein